MDEEVERSFDELAQEFDEYASRCWPRVVAHVLKSQAKIAGTLDALRHLYLLSSFLLDKGMLRTLPDSQGAVGFLYQRCSFHLLAVHSLLRDGCPLEAAALLRTLFEAHAYLLLILEKDTDRRSMLFQEHGKARNHLLLRRWQRALSKGEINREAFEQRFPEDRIRRIEQDYNGVSHLYHPKYPSHWAWSIFSGGDTKASNPDMRSICTHLDLIHDYLSMYEATSRVVHSSGTISDQMKVNGQSVIAPVYSPFSENVGGLAALAGQRTLQGVCDHTQFMQKDLLSLLCFALLQDVLERVLRKEKGLE